MLQPRGLGLILVSKQSANTLEGGREGLQNYTRRGKKKPKNGLLLVPVCVPVTERVFDESTTLD